ncbi:hypothetical protein EJV47_04650 [Hymenobacter gummosus]|uniref:PsbP C-terminal domain-containing protein n=1 Tax=Hymenobacter gummosus TaxID=1776032 RepID=A0A431U6P6_9BACT|nr:hypothetical protein [Hymenobacter gummosus]RTQ52316.1 hypothetical protein EJV47_04650 [Hymenobacter gummosus]
MNIVLRCWLAAILLLGSTSWALGQASGLVEYAQGKKTTYVGDGTGKCLGLKFTLRYPAAWNATDGNRPHIVQKFMNGNGTMALVIIKDLRGVATKADMDQVLSSSSDLSDFTPGTFLSAQRNLTIDGEKAYAIEYSQRQTSATGMTIYQHGIQYMLFYDHYMITIMCATGGEESNQAEFDAQFERNRPFFGLIASSLVLTSKWNNY